MEPMIIEKDDDILYIPTSNLDNIRKYIKKWFTLPFARELEIVNEEDIDNVLEGEHIDDYSDINKIYEEQKRNGIEEDDGEE